MFPLVGFSILSFFVTMLAATPASAQAAALPPATVSPQVRGPAQITEPAQGVAPAVQVLPAKPGVTRGPRAIELKIKEAVAAIRPATVNLKALRQMPNGSFVQSIGSGILISEAGYILTNEHVVGTSNNIEVNLWRANGKKYKARIVGVDKKLDLALLRIRSRNGELFSAARVNELAKPRSGDRVIAIGNPFGLSHTVTSGIVGSTGRTLAVGEIVYEGLIQVDAPINQGNSGGPLVNFNGDVIGINSAVLAEDPKKGNFVGQGFAIPIDVAMDFARQFARLK